VSLVSMRAYARHRGVSLSAVQKAIRSGRVKLVNGGIDVALADVDWAQNTQARLAQSCLHAEQPLRAPLSYVTQETADRFQRALRGAARLDDHLAELAKIEIEERSRRLVDRSEVEAAMLMIVGRTANLLASESDPANVEAILANEIRTALRVDAPATSERGRNAASARLTSAFSSVALS
jgi:hypothetical protein